MKEIEPKVIMSALLPVLLLQYSSLAGAVDIIFYQAIGGCFGDGFGYYDIGPNVCCASSVTNGGSVLVNGAGTDVSGVFSQVYRDGYCSTLQDYGVARGNQCYFFGEYTGAFWYNCDDRRRSLLADRTTCDTQMEPNSVIFTEDSTKGHWILITSNVDHLYSQMQNVSDAEKVDWLKSRGAIFEQV